MAAFAGFDWATLTSYGLSMVRWSGSCANERASLALKLACAVPQYALHARRNAVG